MGMFGSALKKIATPENLYLLGATMKDIGDPGADNFSGAQASIAARQAKAQKAEMVAKLGGLFGGQAAAAAAGVGGQARPAGLNLRDPAVQRQLFLAQQAGIDVKPMIEMYSATKPNVQYDRGIGYDPTDTSNVGGFHPDLNKGERPMYDGQGRLIATGLLPGAAESAQTMSQADQLGKTRGTILNVPRQGGGTAMMTGDQFLTQGQSNIPGLGLTQTPAEAKAADITATAGANAQVGLPQAVANADATLSVIDKLKNHPALKMRTGMFSMVPALPGTPGVSFDALRDQLKGKVFMEAFQSLKGAGQITEVEGTKATNALAALNTAQTTEDFVAALNDLQEVVSKGKDRAAAQAGAGGGQGAFKPRISPQDAIAELRRRGKL